MSAESGKTCRDCKAEFYMINPPKFAGVHLCPLHDGSMAEKLAEALRGLTFSHRADFGCGYQSESCHACKTLAAYDELQGRKG